MRSIRTLPATMQAVLFFRLGYPAAKWRNVYKGLTVLEFLLKRGAEQVLCSSRMAHRFQVVVVGSVIHSFFVTCWATSKFGCR